MSVEPDPSINTDTDEQPSTLVARSAVLDSAHTGDIQGALGTIRV